MFTIVFLLSFIFTPFLLLVFIVVKEESKVKKKVESSVIIMDNEADDISWYTNDNTYSNVGWRIE